jgi:hypothetical protein
VLKPPRAWQVVDRRREPEPSAASAPKAAVLDHELLDMLDARSPLLARAFRSSGAV